MYWITTETANQDHEFTDGDEGQAIPATDLNAAWYNMIQRELLSILAGLNIAPDENNFAQIWDAMKTIGIRAVYSEGDVVTSGFDGSVVIFHDASDFNVGNLKTRSLLIVVPMWNDDSPDYIVFHYGSQNHQIKKGFFFIGMTANGSVEDLSIIGVDLPRAFNGKDLMIGTLNADEVKATSRYEKQLVQFEYSDEIDSSGVEKWRSWQLMANWKVGQVKRVYCVSTNATQSVFVYYDSVLNPKIVIFQKNGFLEFLCTGARSVVVDGVTYNYAVLLVNGKN